LEAALGAKMDAEAVVDKRGRNGEKLAKALSLVKMAEAVVLKVLKRGRNSEKLAKALSFLTSLE
jgi:hypothetical protein